VCVCGVPSSYILAYIKIIDVCVTCMACMSLLCCGVMKRRKDFGDCIGKQDTSLSLSLSLSLCVCVNRNLHKL
jgi:hypothetical protein